MHDAVSEAGERRDRLAPRIESSATVKPMRKPVRMMGSAAGSSTQRNSWNSDAPMERADSTKMRST